MTDRNAYLDIVLEQMPRLLAQLDRNPFSPTYGCFDWNYWHDKITGFHNGHAQESMLALALLHEIDCAFNPYHNSPNIRKWAIAALLYWSRMLHRDGSVDEFYVNERQLGATAISLYAAARTYIILNDHISPEIRRQVKSAISKSSSLLAKRDETHLLSNHQAQAIMALLYSGRILKRDLSDAIRPKIKRILENQSKDGWFKEYNGADMGYLTTTIAFLAEYYSINKSAELKEPLKLAIEFASHFMYPDGFFGAVGSRSTAHCWTSGFELFNSLHPGETRAQAFCDAALEGIRNRMLHTPEKQDRYFSEQITDFLQAFAYHTRGESASPALTSLPCEGSDFSRFFQDSGLYCAKDKGRYIVINAGNGGQFRCYETGSKKLLSCHAGYVGVTSDGKKVATTESSYTMESSLLTVDCEMAVLSDHKQSVIKISALNTFMLAAGMSMGISNIIKDRLISMLITTKKKAGIRVIRRFNLARWTVTETFKLESRTHLQELSSLADFKPKFVAYSKWFDKSALGMEDISVSRKILQELSSKGSATFNRTLLKQSID